MTSDKHEELQTLAAYLSGKQDDLLKEWERIMMGDDGKSTELAKMSRDRFRNDIPEFLNRYYDSLKNNEVSLKDIGRKHGAHRWEFGLNLQQTMQEWNTLHQVIMDAIHFSQDELSLRPASLQKAQKTLAIHIHEGILYSVKEFDELQQSETEAQLLDLQDALEDSDEIARNHNLRGTSHDLKGIMKNLQMGFFLLEEEELGERAAELIEQMSTAADSLEQLLNDLLDLFRLETHREEINISEFNVATVVGDLCESMQPMALTEDLELQYGGAESLPVKTDPKKVERIVRNLILNGLKYTQKGHVEVRWEKKSGEQWMLKISDTGPGLSATHAESLTTEADTSDAVDYEQSPARHEGDVPGAVQSHGEGIGLLIVRHLCQLLDAIIKIKTQPGEGTTFTIVLPTDLSAVSS